MYGHLTDFVYIQEELEKISIAEEWVNATPAYADAFGIVAVNGRAEPERQTASNSAENKS